MGEPRRDIILSSIDRFMSEMRIDKMDITMLPDMFVAFEDELKFNMTPTFTVNYINGELIMCGTTHGKALIVRRKE